MFSDEDSSCSNSFSPSLCCKLGSSWKSSRTDPAVLLFLCLSRLPLLVYLVVVYMVVSGPCSFTLTWIKVMVRWDMSWMVRERCPSSPLMKTQGTFMPPRGWTGNSRRTTPWELRHETERPTCRSNPSPSSSSKSRTSTTMSPSSWMDRTLPGWLRGLL